MRGLGRVLAMEPNDDKKTAEKDQRFGCAIAAQMAVAKMIEHGWLQEVDVNLRRGEPFWRETGNDHRTALVVTDAGLLAIGIEPVVVQTMAAIRKPADETPEAKTSIQRAGIKQAMLIALLQRSEGATLSEIVAATNCQTHTVRGSISGVLKKKLAFFVALEKVEGRGSVYRIC